MYSARLVNSPMDAEADSVKVSKLLPATECTLTGMGGVLSNRSGDFEIDGRDAWIFISIKNRSFNRGYIDRFIDMCETQGLNGYICPVDDPYRYNSMAELQRDDLPQEEEDKIGRLSTDITRMVQKALNGKCSKRVSIVKWRDLEEKTPPVFRAELTKAFHDRTAIRDILYEHISSVKPIQSERDFERYAEFFLCEVPVLMHTYYCNGATLDIYPGPQPKFFWQIELGVFERELPAMTAMTRGQRPMLYLDTHHRPKRKA